MSSLKRVLALTIAMVSLFSLVSFGAWNDEDQIAPELVDDMKLMEALNLYKGDNHGNVNPTATITRAEAAKLIYVIKNYGTDDEAVGWKGISNFSDVPVGHWAEGYINYCVSLGIVAGYGDGNFYPSRPVTGVELAKMLLVVAGYKADLEGYVDNANWAQNIIGDATIAKIFEHYNVAYSVAAPRQWVARMFNNAIFKTICPVYFNNEAIISGALSSNETIGRRYLGLVQAEGTLTSTGKVALTSTKASLNENGKDASVDKGTSTNPIVTAKNYIADINLLGQKVVLNYKPSSGNVDDVDRVYNIYASSKQNVYKVAKDKVTIDVTGTKTNLKFDGYAEKSYGSRTFKVYEDFELVSDTATVADLKNFYGFNKNDGTIATMLDLDQDGFIETVMMTKVQYFVVKAHNPDRQTFTIQDYNTNQQLTNTQLKLLTGSNITFNSTNASNYSKHLNFVDSVAEGDVVAVTLDLSTGVEVYNVEKVETVVGKPASYSMGDVGTPAVSVPTSIVIDGTTYKRANSPLNNFKGLNVTTNNDNTYYLHNGYIVYDEGKSETIVQKNIAYIININRVEKTNAIGGKDGFVTRAQVLLSNGTVAVYDVAVNANRAGQIKIVDTLNNSVENPGPAANLDAEGATTKVYSFAEMTHNLFEYAMVDGKIYFKEILSTSKHNKVYLDLTEGDIEFKYSDQEFKGKDGGGAAHTYVMDSSTYFFVKYKNDGTKYTVLKASELKANAKVAKQAATTRDTFAAVSSAEGVPYLHFAIIELNGNIPAETTTKQYALAGKSYGISKVEASSGDYFKLTVAATSLNGDAVDITFKLNVADGYNGNDDVKGYFDTYVKQKLLGYELEDGMVKVTSSKYNFTVNSNNKAVSGSSGKTVYFRGGSSATMTDSCKIYNVDISGSDYYVTQDGIVATAAETNVEGVYNSNAVYVTNDDGKITAIITEIDGESLAPLFVAAP